jgi:ligand-binding sensor domain-containing protein
MLKRTITLTVALMLFGGAFVLSGCSGEDEPENTGFVERVLDSVSVAVSDNLESARRVDSAAVETIDAVQATAEAPTQTGLPLDIADMTIVNETVYAVFDGGLITYNLDSRTISEISTDEKLNAVAFHMGELYIAGAGGLYVSEEGSLVPVEQNLTGAINTLYSWGANLMIGTTYGLYAKTVLGTYPLLDQMDVTTIVADYDGLWVGTAGQGIYRYDGEEFHKRYLARDPDLFDQINALAFNHGHLYAGTPNGLFIFDGGAWTTVTVDDGLPSNNVTSIDASRWVVHIATDAGVVTWFNGEILPVDRLAEQPAQVVRVQGRKVFAGTADDGLLLKSGPVVKQLTPADGSEPGIASLAH